MNRKLKLEELNRLSIEEYKLSKKHDVVLILDNIRSSSNVGSLFRTADCMGIDKMILCGITPCPPNKDIQKTAIGASESVDWEYFKNTLEAIEILKKNNYKIASIEQTKSSLKLDHLKSDFFKNKIAIILGNEVDGVSQEAINNSDLSIEISQYGTKHSLNVSVCGAIVLYEIVKQKKG